MIVSIIAAVAYNGVIGNGGKMPWKCPEEMKFFKEKTLNHPVIMGRKTWDSLHVKPLPYRYNIIITRDKTFHNAEQELEFGPTFVPSIEDALNYIDDTMTHEAFIIGGAEIWKYALDQDYVDRMYINVLNESYGGDVYFPYYDEKKWINQPNTDVPYTAFKSYTIIKKPVE